MRQTEALSSKQTNKQFNFHTTWSNLGLGENAKQTVPNTRKLGDQKKAIVLLMVLKCAAYQKEQNNS